MRNEGIRNCAVFDSNDPEKADDPRCSSEEEIIGHAYAWGKTARSLCEKAVLEVLNNTDGDFTLVDLCSSQPVFPQILRERHYEGCHNQAEKIIGEVCKTLQTPPKKMPGVFKPHFIEPENSADKIKHLCKAMVPKKTPLRKLITSAIQDFLYNPPPLQTDDNPAGFTEQIRARLESSNVAYESIFEPEGKEKGQWRIIVPLPTEETASSMLSDILGVEEGSAFLLDLSTFLAGKCLPHLRRFKIFSLDIADPEALRNEANKSFPSNFRCTEFFRRQSELKDHIQADIKYLPFGEESVSCYTCVEGWPFYMPYIGADSAILIAKGVANTLKPGGKAIFFPWLVQGETDIDRQVLADIERHWQGLGLEITKEEYRRSQLVEKMGDRELVLTNHSPVFAGSNDNFITLILEKPNSFAGNIPSS